MFHLLTRTFLAFAGGLVLIAAFLMPLTGHARLIEATLLSSPDLHFVDKNSSPLAQATVRVLCYATQSTDTSVNPVLADLLVNTDDNGRPIQSLPAGCNYLAGLHLLHVQPSSKPHHGPAYQVYATSWSPGTRDLLQAVGAITITNDWPLVLFNVVASLEWQPATTSTVVADLRQGLFQASAYLYDLSDGQMAFGPVTIDIGGQNWEGADMRFRAANDYRPTAYMGGIVTHNTPYTTPAGVATVYAPGAVYLGRFWDGQDAFDPITGNWSQENAYRTLVHEWSHYAMFLYDEYQETEIEGGTVIYCTCPGLPEGQCDASAMAYHYTAGELWHSGEHGEPTICQKTDQWYVHRESDWDTIERWSSIQDLPTEWLHMPAGLDAGPDLGLVGDLFGRGPGRQIYLPIIQCGIPARSDLLEPVLPTFLAAEEPTVSFLVSDVLSDEVINAFYPQVYLMEEATPSSPARILYQGTTNGERNAPSGSLGEITLFSVQAHSRIRAFADRYSTGPTSGGRFVYLPSHGDDLPPVNGQSFLLVPDTWQASLDVTYDMVGSWLTTMTLTLVSPTPLTATPIAQLCVPNADIGCRTTSSWRKPMQEVQATTWVATFAVSPGAELPDYGILRVQAPGRGELIRWFQQAGGVGPAHADGHAPLRDGLMMIDVVDALPQASERNRVIVMPAANYDALVATLPVTIGGLIDVPLDLDILLPSLDTDPQEVKLTLFHRQNSAQPVPSNPCHLQILHFDQMTNQWAMVSAASNNDELSWTAATRQVQQGGIYAVGWTTVPCP